MSLRTAATAFLVAASVGLAPGIARADVPPQDACNATDVGKACSNAGPQGNQAGVCANSTCTKYVPPDGGTYTYACTLCLAPGDGGTAGAAGAAGGKASSSDGSGCSVAGAPRDATTGMLLVLGLAGLVARRRKRS